MRFGPPQSPGIEILLTLLESVVHIPMNGCCPGGPKEANSEMEISMQEGYLRVLWGRRAMDKKGKRQEPAEGVIKL